jgi:hypothetical protein
MKVESDVLIYFHYEDMKRKFSDSALNAQNQPLTKLRFKPQVSAAFASVSILIDAQRVDTRENTKKVRPPRMNFR